MTQRALVFSATVSGKLQQDILFVTLDHPPVNAVSADVRAGLMAALDRAESGDVAGMVITGAGKTFIAGADIREFSQPPVPPHLPDVLARIEDFAKPVIAAINGAALGGGCELALACHHRIASPAARLGLPEVTLGIVPGAGGTQRLPRLIGPAAAIDLIGFGRTVTAQEAKALGLVDAVADDAVGAAMKTLPALDGAGLRRTGQLVVPSADPDAADAAAAIIAKARGRAAPAEAIRLVRLAPTVPLAQGLAEERAAFLRLKDGAEAAALRHVFFAERQAEKVEKLAGIAPRNVTTVGVVGLGLMGAGIAFASLSAGLKVIGIEQTPEALEQGRGRLAALFERAQQAGRLDADRRRAQEEALTLSPSLDSLADADVVIEAVFDDLHVKTDLFRRLDAVVPPDAVLATNTSYLNPDVIAAATARPDRVVGLHFFSPAHVMRLVEVVDAARTAPDVLATAFALAKTLRKLPVIAGVTEGFIGNRVFSAYRREAEFLLEDGALPHEVDAALETYGFPMGVFAVNDLAGLSIAWAKRKREAPSRDPAARYVDIADRLCEAGRLGQKAGNGWYDYADGRRIVSSEVTAMIDTARTEKGLTPRAVMSDEIVTRLLAAMAAEGRALLAEGIVSRASDIDLVMINGYGFPAHKGGPMFAAGMR